MWLYLFVLALGLTAVGPVFAQQPGGSGRNLALNKPVSFCPAPNYRLTREGDTDPFDLTDGRLTEREDLHMWFEAGAVSWSYSGRVSMSVDLGEVAPVEEVSVRFLGGSPQPGIAMPGWVEVLVSEGPGEPYTRVAEYSRWTPGDHLKYGIPRHEGTAWVHRLRFGELRTRARFVGIRFYGTGLTCSDELYILKGQHTIEDARPPAGPPDGFTVTGAQVYFHKPVVFVTGDIVTPVPLGCAAVPRGEEEQMIVSITPPEGVEILGGTLGGVGMNEADVGRDPSGRTRYTWRLRTKDPTNRAFGRLYMTGRPKGDGPSELVYSVHWDEYRSPEMTVPIEIVEIPAQPHIPKRLMTSLSWWDLGATRNWPRREEAFRHIGFNTVPVFGTYFDPEDSATVAFAAGLREAGYRIQMIDSTWHRMLRRAGDDAEIYCQFEDGSNGSDACPSYRGRHYREELRFLADAVGQFKPSVLSCDIELWNWRGPADAPDCTRCRADKAKSGMEDWKAWQLAKGEEMWKDMYDAVQGAVRTTGGPRCELGGYDFRPGKAYQFFWPFGRLYPGSMQSSQVSVYTPLEPDHVELVGNEVRHDRALLPRSDQLPWITPGDAGTFPGESFRYALLEVFCNGARGVNFWSSRVWDADVLAAYARAIRAVAPVEDILVDGNPYLPQVEGPGRVSGMKYGDEIVLLVADYHGVSGGGVAVRLDLDRARRIMDLDTRAVLADLEPGRQVLRVPLDGVRARILHIGPQY